MLLLRKIVGSWLIPVAFVAAVVAIGALSRNGGPSVPTTPSPTGPTATVPTVQVPAVEGVALQDATALLQDAGLRPQVIRRYSHESPGTVLGQHPIAGSSVVMDAAVELRVAQPFLRIPSVVGLPVSKARDALRQDFSPAVNGEVCSTSPKNTVLSQSPQKGTEARSDRTVGLVISKGPGLYGNPWAYDFDCRNLISNPPSSFCSFFPCIDNFWYEGGYVIQCVDGWFSQAGGISGSCSSHGGNKRPLLAP
jgi:hypothetical protein